MVLGTAFPSTSLPSDRLAGVVTSLLDLLPAEPFLLSADFPSSSFSRGLSSLVLGGREVSRSAIADSFCSTISVSVRLLSEGRVRMMAGDDGDSSWREIRGFVGVGSGEMGGGGVEMGGGGDMGGVGVLWGVADGVESFSSSSM